MIYTTYILVHPRTQQLQNVLTLEDYHQIQALLEYCLQRQQLQNDYLQQQRQEHQNRQQARLIQALHNNKLLQLDYRRQRAAQIQRLMNQHQEQLDRYDRAHLLAALERQRAQQCFQRFIQQHNQHQHEQHEQQPASYIAHEHTTDQAPQQHRQQPFKMPAPAEIQLVDTAKDDIGTTAKLSGQQQQEDDESDQQQSDNEQVGDAYDQYQTQQLEDLLKHIFEKNTNPQYRQHQQQQQQTVNYNDDDEDDEYAYAPYSYQQEDPEDEQTMAELLPILNEQRGDGGATTPPIPPKSMMVQQKQQQQQQQKESQPMDTTTTATAAATSQTETDDSAFLPDNVLPLQDVVDDLVRIPTPAVQQQQQQPLPPKEATQPPPPPPQEDNKERADKLAKLAVIERTLDQLATTNQTDGITRLPLQYQVNDQGGLVLDGNTHNNHQFLMLEDDIIRCMLQLDQILSDGDPVVRDRRRQIVKKAERLLEPLDQHKQAEWTKETKRQQQQQEKLGGVGKKKKHRHHGKRKVRVPVTA